MEVIQNIGGVYRFFLRFFYRFIKICNFFFKDLFFWLSLIEWEYFIYYQWDLVDIFCVFKCESK